MTGHQPAAAAAMTALDRIFREIPTEFLPAIDTDVRARESYYLEQAAARLLRQVDGDVGGLVVASFLPSGYTRQRAVERLGKMHSGAELPFLLLRLSDWVGPVRDAASRLLGPKVRADYVAHWARCLPLIERVRRQSRGSRQPILDDALALLRTKSAGPALHALVISAGRTTRRAAFHLMLATGGEVTETTDIGRVSRDPQIRMQSARHARAVLHGPPLRTLLDRLAGDRFDPVRREALYGTVEQFPEAAPADLHRALFDPGRSIRDAARFYLRHADATVDDCERLAHIE